MKWILCFVVLSGCAEDLVRECASDVDCLQDNQRGTCMVSSSSSGIKF